MSPSVTTTKIAPMKMIASEPTMTTMSRSTAKPRTRPRLTGTRNTWFTTVRITEKKLRREDPPAQDADEAGNGALPGEERKELAELAPVGREQHRGGVEQVVGDLVGLHEVAGEGKEDQDKGCQAQQSGEGNRRGQKEPLVPEKPCEDRAQRGEQGGHASRSYPGVRRSALRYSQLERREPRRRRHAVRVPAAERVVLVEHRAELVGRAIHAGRRALGDGLVHDLPREHVVTAPHALARVEQPLEVDDALPHALELLDGHVPAGHGADHPRVG